MLKSNITIAPNIYVRSSADINKDEEFVRQVYGYKALNALRAKLPKTKPNGDPSFTRPQTEEMRQNVTCRLGKTREHVYGKSEVDGKVVWSCRCEYNACHNYEKCMTLPNAVRIDRSAVLSGAFALVDTTQNRDTNEAGFDYEDANFEPPHVSVILPIINDILAGGTGIAPQSDGAQTNAQEVTATVTADEFREDPDKRVLVICENAYEVGYFSTILYKNGVRHRVSGDDGCTLNRRIADMFWDYCGGEIDKESFLMRYSVRVESEDNGESEANEFFDALFALCGCEESGRLKITALADALNRASESVSECLLNTDELYYPVVVSTLDDISADDEYDEIMLLTGDAHEGGHHEDKRFDLFTAIGELYGSPPGIVKKESVGGWMFSKSVLGRPCRVGLDNYSGGAGRYCLNVELGLPGDVDGKSFLTEQTGDAIRLQLYIAEQIAEGDALTVEKSNEGVGYRFCHNGNVLGEFPPSIIREVCSIEGFPDDFIGFEGVYVRNIVTCVSSLEDPTVPPRFRETGIWLGLDITGYAKIMLS
ncbi:MAG: hypothetical protein FWG45_01190 [Oscillospiraceae bacterium]|nr:hypothetical protein [Oscillospiraceae bacterium]